MLVEKPLLTKLFEKPNIIFAFDLLTIVNTNKIAKAKKIAIFPKILHEVLKIPREALKIPREALKIPPRGAYDVTRPTFRKARFGKSENPPARRILAEPGTRPIFRKNGFSGFYGENGFAQQSDIDFRVLWVKRNDSI